MQGETLISSCLLAPGPRSGYYLECHPKGPRYATAPIATFATPVDKCRLRPEPIWPEQIRRSGPVSTGEFGDATRRIRKNPDNFRRIMRLLLYPKPSWSFCRSSTD